jgi:hypothetical protein
MRGLSSRAKSSIKHYKTDYKAEYDFLLCNKGGTRLLISNNQSLQYFQKRSASPSSGASAWAVILSSKSLAIAHPKINFSLGIVVMSGPLVSAGSESFQQSGQLDWVSLSNTTFSFGLDVLVRLSKAQLDPATMAVSLITCNQFVIKPVAQKRIYDALLSLKSFSSYGKLIWFGFGIKPILTDLAETEPGMACVALCACMSMSYDSYYVAQVLREFCKLQETPSHIIPSIHQ